MSSMHALKIHIYTCMLCLHTIAANVMFIFQRNLNKYEWFANSVLRTMLQWCSKQTHTQQHAQLSYQYWRIRVIQHTHNRYSWFKFRINRIERKHNYCHLDIGWFEDTDKMVCHFGVNAPSLPRPREFHLSPHNVWMNFRWFMLI